MAEYYLNSDKKCSEPWSLFLAGWSFGGVVAFEMAKLLLEMEEKVAFLGLLDSYPPDMLRHIEKSERKKESFHDDKQYLARIFASDLLGKDDLQFAPDKDIVTELLGMPQVAELLPGITQEEVNRLFSVFQANRETLLRYDMTPCDLPITLIRASSNVDEEPGKEWFDYVQGKLSVQVVSGDHNSFLQRPFLNSWAADFSLQLEDAKISLGS